MTDAREVDDALTVRMRDASPTGRDVQAERWHADVAARLFGRPAPALTIGRYRVVDRLGSGASGEVWAAIDPALDRRVAIKVLHDALGPAHARAQMVREAKALAKLSHPNVVPVFDAGVHDGRVFVTLELVEGTTLRVWSATPRPWPAIVAVFVQVARGLHAAHRAGIVHRDVKPENILIGDDGRVRVSDFGIARGTDPLPRATLLETAPLRGDTSTAGVGTPAYMAPEQFLGEPIDARTDQFGFCVALHEALYGERPFDGEDRARLAANVTAGRRRPPPASRAVPGWLARTVERGLRSDRSQRFADMAALLRELERPGRGRWRMWGIAAVACTAFVALVRPADDVDDRRSCDSGAQRIDAVWNPRIAAEVHAAFEATAAPHAALRAEAQIAQLDGFATSWRDAHATACATLGDDGTRIAQQYCLHTRLLELEAMVAAFVRIDANALEHATASAPPAPEECLYVVAAPGSATRDPEQDLELRATIAAARTQGQLGRHSEGLATGAAAIARARELGSRSLEAEALLATAELQTPLVGSVDGVDPQATLHGALLAAEAAHRPDLVALATVASMEAALAHGEYARARSLEPAARRATAALADPPELVGRIELCSGAVSLMEDDDGAAVASLQRARAEFERSGRSSRRWLAQTLNLIGETEFRRGDHDAARPHYARALAILDEDLWAHHPLVANASGNLAETYFVVGDFDTAAAHFDTALAIRREVFGGDSVWVAHTLGHVGDVAWERGDAPAALAAYTEGLRSSARRSQAEESATQVSVMRDLQRRAQQGWMRNGRALALMDLGRLDEALREAELGHDTPLPADHRHPDLTSRIDVYGLVLLAMGRTERAITAFEAALSQLEAQYPADSRPIAVASIGLGRARLAAGDLDIAAIHLQRGLAILAAVPGGYPRVRAAGHFALGQAWSRDPARALLGRDHQRIAIALLADSAGVAEQERAAMLAMLDAPGR